MSNALRGAFCWAWQIVVAVVLVVVGNFSHAYLRITLCRRFCVEAECKITFSVVQQAAQSGSENVFSSTFPGFPFAVIYARFACFKAIVKVFCAQHCEQWKIINVLWYNYFWPQEEPTTPCPVPSSVPSSLYE